MELYSKVVPYNNLVTLIDDLKKELQSAHEKAQKLAGILASEAINLVKIKIQTRLTLTPKELEELTVDISRIAFPYLQEKHAKENIESFLDIYAGKLNALPFVTFKPMCASVKAA